MRIDQADADGGGDGGAEERADQVADGGESKMAWRGVRTFVETTVAMALAAS